MRNAFTTSAAIESLETRRLFSGAILARGVLHVFGDFLSANAVTIANSPDQLNVDVTINSTNRLGQTKTFTKSFAKALGISAVWVRTGVKNDSVIVNEQDSNFTIGVRVDSGPGDDLVTTGSGNDIVFAGAGNDAVNTGNGMDWIRGMLGNDAIDAGGGNDRVNAGPGNDAVTAGGGADVVRGEFGDDLIDGGSGDDLLYGGVGNDALVGGSGNDALWGGVGDDSLSGGQGNDTIGGFLGTNVLHGEGDQDTFIVKQLAANPDNDYDAATDILMVVTRLNEGGKPPAI